VDDKFTILDLETLQRAALQEKPFPYLLIDNIIRPEVLQQVVTTFPKMNNRGSFPSHSLSCTGEFKRLLEELHRPELRSLIGQRFGMDLEDKPPMVTVRGYTTERDGHIHVDSKSKLITFLLYLNPNWQASGGRLRLLYNDRDLSPYAAEISPEAGRCVIFEVTPNCWHGHEVFVGERKSLQLNYVLSEETKERQLKRHGFSAFLKKIFSKKKDEAHSAY
jgi:SM-20-related protein